MENFNTLGEKLRFARKKKGMSIRQVSEQSGVSALSIGNWEDDKTEPNFFNLCCVAQVLDLSLEYLAGWENLSERKRPRRKEENADTVPEKITGEDPYVGLAEFLMRRKNNGKTY